MWWVLFSNSCWFEIELTFDTEYFISSVCAFPVWGTFVDLTPLTRDLKCICSHVTTAYFSVRFNLRLVVGLNESKDYMVWVTVVKRTGKLSVCTPRGHMGEPRHWSILSQDSIAGSVVSFTPRVVPPGKCILVRIEQDTLCTQESVVLRVLLNNGMKQGSKLPLQFILRDGAAQCSSVL